MILRPAQRAILTLTGQTQEGIMQSKAHDDIRRLLKEFGVTADETISAYLIEAKPAQPLRLRIVLEDLTEYSTQPREKLYLEVEGEVGLSH